MNKQNVGLMLLENSIVLYSKSEKQILKVFELNQDELKQEIDNIMKENIFRPVEIFATAVENMLFPYKFFDLRKKISIAGNMFYIHDQELFKKWKDYISSCEHYKDEIKRFVKEKEEKRIQERKIAQFNGYVAEKSEIERRRKHLL